MRISEAAARPVAAAAAAEAPVTLRAARPAALPARALRAALVAGHALYFSIGVKLDAARPALPHVALAAIKRAAIDMLAGVAAVLPVAGPTAAEAHILVLGAAEPASLHGRALGGALAVLQVAVCLCFGAKLGAARLAFPHVFDGVAADVGHVLALVFPVAGAAAAAAVRAKQGVQTRRHVRCAKLFRRKVARTVGAFPLQRCRCE